MRERHSYVFLLPALALIAAVTLYPLAYLVFLSFHRYMPIFDISEFVGARNFWFLTQDERFWAALGNTVYFTVISVALECVIGLCVALAVSSAFRGRAIVMVALLLPWAMPTVVTARMWEWMLDTQSGVINYLLSLVGLSKENWLGDPALALHAAILVDVWKTTPFVVILLAAALTGIPADVIDAARVDGASPARIVRKIILPLLSPALLVVVILRLLDAFRVFDSVYVLTGGGPAGTTETVSLYAYRLFFRTLQFGYGATVSLVVFLFTAIFTLLYIRLFGPAREERV